MQKQITVCDAACHRYRAKTDKHVLEALLDFVDSYIKVQLSSLEKKHSFQYVVTLFIYMFFKDR